jgi:hypothetical protein
MEDRDLQYVQEYHQRLVHATHIERQFKNSRPSRPSWSDYLLLRFGDSLIAVGQKVKNGSSISQASQRADLSQECA